MPKLGKLFAIGAVALGVAFSAFGVNAEEPPPSRSTAESAPSPRNRSCIWSGV